MASTNFAGMGSGLDLNSLISQLIAVERQPLTKLKSRQDALRRQVNAIEGINTRMSAMSSSAAALSSPSKWGTTKAVTSDAAVATVTNSGQGSSGTLSFNVTALASAHSLRSSGTVPAISAQVAAASSTLVIGRGLSALGIAEFSNPTGVRHGKIDVAVTRSSAAAVKTSGSVAASVTIDSSNNTLAFEINGDAKAITIAAGTYDRSGLAAAINTALDTVGADVEATASETALALSSIREGSQASLKITGGSALAALALSVDATATTGVDALMTFDGVETVVSNVEAGGSMTANAASAGSLTMKFAGGIRAGSAVVASVSTGDGSLSAVVDNINAQKAATGITAASVRVGTSSFRMQVSSMQTGVASKLSINSASLSGAGALLENSMATDAEVTIGSGAGAYSATSSKNSFTDLLPGSNITVLKLGSATVTAAADSNAEGVADLIAKTNTVLSYIAEQSRSSAAASGVLSGDASVRRFAESLRRSVLSTSSTTRAGISVDRSGTLTFNREAYEAAYAADPEGVRNLFAQSASTLAGASFLQATDRTQAGSYNVNVTQVATRAMATVSDWSIPMAFSQGTLNATYTPNPAATPAELAAGLTTFFTNNSFGLAAAVQGGNVAVTASAWGTDGTFRLNTTSYAGNNVTGSIDGVAATGAGRTLYLPTSSTSQAAGLRLTVSATTPGDLGAINYQPGIAGSLRLLAITAGENSSPLRAAKASRETRIKSADSQLAALERRLKAREDQMRRQYSALDSNIGRLNNTSSWLAQQTSQISR